MKQAVAVVAGVGFALVLLALYYAGIALPAGLRGGADNLGFPVHRHFGLVESLVFNDAPNRLAQRELLHVSVLQYAAFYVYLSWFLIPVIAALPLICTRDRRAFQLIAFLVVTYALAVPIFVVFPLAPPWIHDPRVANIANLLHPGARNVDDNAFAAFPSLHVALPAAAALWYGGNHSYRWTLWGYAALMSATVLYSGDHYAADIVAGMLLAALAMGLARRLRLPVLREARGDRRAAALPVVGEARPRRAA